ncbi:MAG: metallophosphoesterase [Oscillospiraceae bacterium]|nr:metallophosphoesterase [Oscillospiraceae bacterium]
MNLLPFEISFAAVFKEIAAYLMSAIACLFSFISPMEKTFLPLDAANLQAQFSVISDTHIEINPAEEGVVRFQALREGLLNISNAAVPVDAVVMAGDNTENGQVLEYMTMYNYLRRFGGMDLVIAMGNHETFGLNHDQIYSRALSNFTCPYNLYTGEKISKAYYFRVVKGYYFIVLGTDEIISNTASYISPEQLVWLDGVLKQATADGKPAFLVNHQPFLGSHGMSDPAEGMGEQNDAVYEIVSKYKNVFYFSGHVHFDSPSYEHTEEGVNLIALPCFGKSGTPGGGVQVEVYPDTVQIRGRNFARDMWMDFSVGLTLE